MTRSLLSGADLSHVIPADSGNAHKRISKCPDIALKYDSSLTGFLQLHINLGFGCSGGRECSWRFQSRPQGCIIRHSGIKKMASVSTGLFRSIFLNPKTAVARFIFDSFGPVKLHVRDGFCTDPAKCHVWKCVWVSSNYRNFRPRAGFGFEAVTNKPDTDI